MKNDYVIIERATNGFSVIKPSEIEGEEDEFDVVLCQEKVDGKIDDVKLVAFVDVIYELQEIFGIHRGKHDEYSLEIKIKRKKNE